MRKILLAVAALLPVSLATGISVSASNSAAQIVNCTATTPWCFSPNPIRITVGSTVTWTNTTAPTHTATSNTGAWDTGSIASGQTSAAMTFKTPGTFAYHCSFHSGMTGTVIVSAASASPAATSPPARSLAPSGGGPVLPIGAVLVLLGLTLLVTRRYAHHRVSGSSTRTRT